MVRPGQKKFLRHVPAALAGVIALAVVGGVVAFARNMLSNPSDVRKSPIQQVKIIRPPEQKIEPPPPPPPPPEEEIPDDVPEEANDDAPPAEQLGLDADGSAGADGFGLLARKGGRDLLASGGAFTSYAALLKNEILDRLQENGRARAGAYSIVVRVWLSADGGVERVKLVSSTGDRELDSAIESVLSGMQRVAQAPPPEMPQPVSLRIVSRI